MEPITNPAIKVESRRVGSGIDDVIVCRTERFQMSAHLDEYAAISRAFEDRTPYSSCGMMVMIDSIEIHVNEQCQIVCKVSRRL